MSEQKSNQNNEQFDNGYSVEWLAADRPHGDRPSVVTPADCGLTLAMAKKRANGLLAGGRVKMAVIVTPDGHRLTHWEGR